MFRSIINRLLAVVVRSTLRIDGKTVLDFFQRLMLSEADQVRIRANINKLDSETFKERDQATNELIAEGIRVLFSKRNSNHVPPVADSTWRAISSPLPAGGPGAKHQG
jgi:hypothetical protein